MRHFYARASWPGGCDPKSMPMDSEPSTCKLDRQHLIRTCFPARFRHFEAFWA